MSDNLLPAAICAFVGALFFIEGVKTLCRKDWSDE